MRNVVLKNKMFVKLFEKYMKLHLVQNNAISRKNVNRIGYSWEQAQQITTHHVLIYT